jgi:hypothetical protein
MKKYSANISQLLNLDNLSPYFLVKLDFKSGAIYHTSTPMDVVVSALGATFISNNTLLSIDAPRLSAIVDRESYKITYADNDFSFRSIFASGVIGTPVTVFVGFYNTTDAILGGALPSMPLANYEDLVIAYKGAIDSHGHATDTEGQVTAVIECTSPMASLDLVKPFYTSKDAMAQLNPTDIAFDQVYVGSKGLNLVWGKK